MSRLKRLTIPLLGRDRFFACSLSEDALLSAVAQTFQSDLSTADIEPFFSRQCISSAPLSEFKSFLIQFRKKSPSIGGKASLRQADRRLYNFGDSFVVWLSRDLQKSKIACRATWRTRCACITPMGRSGVRSTSSVAGSIRVRAT
jgi:hypothetical protein